MRILFHSRRIWDSSKRYVNFAWNSTVLGTRIDSPPIFLVGFNHSGTSVSLVILGEHSRIHAIPYETKILEKESKLKFDFAMHNFNLRAIAANKHRWVEKTPNHQKYIGQILEWCPEAKIVMVLRDGRDVAASIKKRSGDLNNAMERWVETNRQSQQFWDHPNVYLYKYEDLITDFEKTVTGILTFLGEDYEPSMLNFHNTNRRFYSFKLQKPENAFGVNHAQHRNWQINQPLFDGRGRWKELSDNEICQITDIGGELLTELGYLGQNSQQIAS